MNMYGIISNRNKVVDVLVAKSDPQVEGLILSRDVMCML